MSKDSEINRRDFIKTTTRAGAGLAALAELSLFPSPDRAFGANNHGQTKLPPPLPASVELDGNNWKLGSFAPGEGEAKQAFLSSFEDGAFRTVTVPGEVQRQLGIHGMDLYYQSRELTLVNNQEWWYRLRFTAPKEAANNLVRLSFDGVDYFCTVWLNGQKLGDHEGGQTRFVFDVRGKLIIDRDNLLAVKVTCPWLPPGRAVVEYLRGSFYLTVTTFPNLPYSMGGKWDGVPAGGNAVFPMGISRNVQLLISEPVIVDDLAVHTKALHSDGSATIVISGNVRNYESTEGSVTASFRIEPGNFPDSPVRLPDRTMTVHAGSNPFAFEAVLKNPRLWWTWDTGAQNLYRIVAEISKGAGSQGDQRQATFGIRTITRDKDFTYSLNGKRVFVRGAWYPMGDYFASVPTRARYETDLRLLRAAHANHIVNHTVVEKPAFYDACDELGILVFVQLPFSQGGPDKLAEASNPRHAPFMRAALGQVRDIVTALQNHPSIVQWSPLAEAREEGKWVGPQEGYQQLVDAVGKIVAEVDPDTLYHPSLCDLGEHHFWTAANHYEDSGSYQQLFDAQALLVSEYGSMSMPNYETLKQILSPEDMWSEPKNADAGWFGLPINISAYAYLTSYEYYGLHCLLEKTNQFIDSDIRSVKQLIDASQLYQGFLYQYATEAFRRKKYNPIHGMRIWDYVGVWPGISFNFLDYGRTPKLSYHCYRRALEPLTVSFAYQSALESQVSGKRLSIPVWMLNDYHEGAQVEVACEISDIAGKVVWKETYHPTVDADSSALIGTVEWTTPDIPGVYVLRGRVLRDGKGVAESTTYIKVTARAFARSPRVLLIGEQASASSIAALLQGAGVTADTIEGSTMDRLVLLGDASALRREYDAVWLASFDMVWKLLDAQMVQGLLQGIRDGLGFIHTGGMGSFHGGAGRAACLEFTGLDAALPVTLRDRNDLVYPAGGDVRLPPGRARFKSIEAVDPAGRWADPGFRNAGITGFNEVSLKPDATLLMTISGRPLLVSGTYGQGRVMALTALTPALEWDEKAIDPEFLDQAFVEKPDLRPYFELFLRMLAEASGQPLVLPTSELLAMRQKPLFQSLKERPAATLKMPESVGTRVNGGSGILSLEISNGGEFARLVRMRAEWDDAKPDVVLFSDNYFDLMPGEIRRLTADVRFIGAAPAGRVRGRLIVEGSNVPETQIPITLDVV
jgi:beta-mannosidase